MIGPVAGVWADRGDRTRIMVAMDRVRFVTVTVMSWTQTPWVLLGMAAIASAGVCVFWRARGVTIPILLFRTELTPAMALSQLSSQLMGLLGPALAGIWISVVNVPSAFWIDALSFVGSIALVPSVAVPSPTGGTVAPGSVASDLVLGIRYLRQHRANAFLVLFAAIPTFGLSGLTVLALPLIRQLYQPCGADAGHAARRR